MSLNLNDSDFQCLQDQIIDLKAKNYELAQKDRRSHADFEAAKAKICSLQLKLEEQERDFQVISTTLRREIETLSNELDKENSKDEDYKAKYKKLLHKAKELQSRYEKAVEIIQQLDDKNQLFSDRVEKLESEYSRKCNEWESMWEEIETNWNKAVEKYKLLYTTEKANHDLNFGHLKNERDELRLQVDDLTSKINSYDSKLEAEAEERKINEKKFHQMIKELKRQLGLEQSRSETLQKRLKTLLINMPPSETSTPGESQKNKLSTSSTNGNSSGKITNVDANSVGSWSFVKGKNESQALNETLSLCSIDSDDRETVQHSCDKNSESDQKSMQILSSPTKTNLTSNERLSSSSDIMNGPSGMLVEEQAALMDRLTKMQHDKWQLDEKLSYLEQINASLTQDLANKSDIIRHHFMEQANKSTSPLSFNTNPYSNFQKSNQSRRSSLTTNFNNIISEKPGFKKVVEFLKERSHLPESECLSKEATKRMQLMLEETLIKNLKLQENLDYVTSELNRLKGH